MDAFFAGQSGFWRHVYERQDVFSAIHRLRNELVLELADGIGLPGGARVLDAGCGAGLLSVALARRGYQVDAIDSVPSMLEQARKAALAAGVGGLVSTAEADVCRMSFPEPAYGLVLMIGLLPWLGSPARALSQAARALRPGGYLIVTEDNAWRLVAVLDPWALGKRNLAHLLRRFGMLWPPAAPQTRRSSRRRFRRMLLEHGFEPVRVRTFGFGPFTFLNRRVLPPGAGVALHGFLQRLADAGVPVLRAAGTQHLVLARRR